MADKSSNTESLDYKKKIVKDLLDSNPLITFNDIFNVIPRTAVALGSGINKVRISPKAENPKLFKVGELIVIAKFLGVSTERILKVALIGISSTTEEKK